MKTILKITAVSLLLIVVGAGGSVAWAAKSKNPATNYPSLVGASEIKDTRQEPTKPGQIDEVLIARHWKDCDPENMCRDQLAALTADCGFDPQPIDGVMR